MILTDFKICTVCKTEKPISEFDVLQKKDQKPYIQGFCKSCRRIKTNARSKIYYQENIEKKRAYEVERRKLPGYSQKQLEYKKKHQEKLTDGIVAWWLSQKMKIPVPEIYKIEGLIEAERSRIQLNRKIKEFDTADPDFRVCSKCFDKKPIEEFRLRTEKRYGKKPYTYRSGQCKICESLIKNSYKRK